jgi:hypothetical protein
LALDLMFPTRAVQAFVAAAGQGRLGPRHISDVLKYDKVDVAPIEPLLKSADPWIRQCAAKVVAARGNRSLLLEAAKVEGDKNVLMLMLDGLTQMKEGLEELAHMLSNEDPAIANDVIQMFRRAGRSDCLLALAFSSDDALVARVKRYMEEQDVAEQKKPRP